MSNASHQAARTIAITVEGEPCPWQVYTRQGRPSVGVLAFQAYQTLIQLAIKKVWANPPMTGPVALVIQFYRGIPEACPKTHPAYVHWLAKHLTKRPDLTNYVKACEDALKGLLIVDDSQVVSLSAMKAYSETGPHTIIVVHRL